MKHNTQLQNTSNLDACAERAWLDVLLLTLGQPAKLLLLLTVPWRPPLTREIYLLI